MNRWLKCTWFEGETVSLGICFSGQRSGGRRYLLSYDREHFSCFYFPFLILVPSYFFLGILLDV